VDKPVLSWITLSRLRQRRFASNGLSGATLAHPRSPGYSLTKSVRPVFGNYFPILKGPAQIGLDLRIIGGLERDRGIQPPLSAGPVFLDN
jgi:hypothetical protein